jgi:monofunctional biosynthetic peptidoglycan transglycosylase
VAGPRQRCRVAWRRFLRATGTVLAATLVLGATYLATLAVLTPDVEPLARGSPETTSFMRLRAAQRGEADVDRGAWIDIDEVSPYLICAVVKAEDRGYFRHDGFEWGEIRRAAWLNLRGASRMGASTITQQLARNLYLSPDRSIHRKLREAFITRRLEEALDKKRILELYLNAVEWGDGIWGVRRAARHYFGRSPAELDPFAAAFLAGLLPAPRRPFEGANRDRALGVQRRVLDQLYFSGLLDARQRDDAQARVSTLGRLVARGRPLPTALATATRRSAVRPALAPTVERVLVDECGLALELERARARQRRPGTHVDAVTSLTPS